MRAPGKLRRTSRTAGSDSTASPSQFGARTTIRSMALTLIAPVAASSSVHSSGTGKTHRARARLMCVAKFSYVKPIIRRPSRVSPENSPPTAFVATGVGSTA